MYVVVAVYLMVALLLGGAGAAKAITPEPASVALARLGLPHHLWMVRVLGIAELAVAVGAFVLGGVGPAIGLAVLYSGFAMVAGAMIRSGSAVPCGCFGRTAMPATARHVVINILASAAGIAAALWSVEAIDQLVHPRRWLLGPLVALLAAGAFGLFLLLNQNQPDKTNHQTSPN
ncbi:MauE/DoxX family redox-associated membrane protein [Candidatus Poriferisocius sp.]|uniref:MauE/DoxX family redox-associated membrane protein n=1 Tax=Candidatus Poriferisocius sp. TaxID=3101276 RepID=UPI003B01D0AB